MTKPAPLATEDDVAAFLQITPRALAELRRAGRGPARAVETGRAIRYHWADVYAWVNRTREKTSVPTS